MRNAVAVPAIGLLFLTRCSAGAAEPGALPASAPAAESSAEVPSAEAASRDSEEPTCTKLLETNGDGPLYQSIYLLKMGDGMSGFGESAETANSDWNVNVETWKSAVAEHLTHCAPYETATNSAASPAAPATAGAETASAAYSGYPLLVDAASLHYRVAPWLTVRGVEGQVVALAPGLYAPYDPAAPDPSSYYGADGVTGDSTMKQIIFPESGTAATWSAVRPGSQEPR